MRLLTEKEKQELAAEYKEWILEQYKTIGPMSNIFKTSKEWALRNNLLSKREIEEANKQGKNSVRNLAERVLFMWWISNISETEKRIQESEKGKISNT